MAARLALGAAAALLLSAQGAAGAVGADRVHALPGWPHALPSRHYSGYLSVPGSNGTRKHLHYYLVLSQKEGAPADGAGEPVVLWQNGGPGCSSLDGLWYEHGPFRINAANNSLLEAFEFSWSKLANVLYLEAPAGVGFSWAEDASDYVTNDDKNAVDNLAAMQKFYELFPELKPGALFLTGESYSGIYTPTLAEAIMQADKAGEWRGARLTGIAVGNGCTGTELGICSNEGNKEKYLTAYLSQTALVSPESKRAVAEACGDFAEQVPSLQGACKEAVTAMHAQVSNVNLYNVYGECHGGSEAGVLKAPVPVTSYSNVVADVLLRGGETLAGGANSAPGPQACIDSRFATNYLIQPAVVAALHVKVPPYEWGVCKNQIKYTPTRPNLPRDTYPELVEYLDRTVIYNGDWDACVPWTDNIDWTSKMAKSHAFREDAPWHPWSYVAADEGSPQVGGYAVTYKTARNQKFFYFITVRGGRHEVPETAPESALELVRKLISGDQF